MEHLEAQRHAHPEIQPRVIQLLEEFITAIDRDLGLLSESATGLEEVPVETVVEPWLQQHRATETLGVEA